ncbi:MAG: thioredoxin family protein [Steroidobacteraceae bacterium]|nr:thioredoxin family protein [Steroidobacteraceae bacterium]MBP7013598.1 thioredoxin family protein [Steroidobacteraceae bacterium]
MNLAEDDMSEMKLKSVACTTIVAALLLAGCDRRKDEPPPPPEPQSAPAADAATKTADESHLPPGIDWFSGDVDAAFAAARKADKPVFLYWGAEWCPPCAQIKTTIFSKREFQQRSRLFVPVYLDGDTPSAQKYGERFGVIGYPTMILFKPDGTEITRLPGGVDVARYARILDVALADARPVSDILAAARSGDAVTSNDWKLLAYYSWSTDAGHVLPADQQLATFRALAQRCPAELPAECARFFFAYLGAAATASEPGKPALDGLERADARRRLLAMLPSPAVQAANVDNLLYGPKDAIGVLSSDGTPERAQLTRAWSDALDQLGGEAKPLSASEELLRVRARVMLARLDAPDAPLSPALLDSARQAVARVDAATPAAYQRQAAINAAANLYWEAGLEAEASTLLTAELDKSGSPYYFMLDLADLAEKAGRKQEAVDWLARAYAGAKGPATRFQWGYNYLVGLLEMTPEDVQGIERAGLAVLGELDGSPDAFYQRTRMRLEQLDAKLLEWGQAGAAARVIETLRARTGEICRKLPEKDAGRANCEKFLSAKARPTQAA